MHLASVLTLFSIGSLRATDTGLRQVSLTAHLCSSHLDGITVSQDYWLGRSPAITHGQAKPWAARTVYRVEAKRTIVSGTRVVVEQEHVYCTKCTYTKYISKINIQKSLLYFMICFIGNI